MAFSLFNFIKALSQNFHNIMPKNDGVFKVQFANKNLALKMPKQATKMPKWAKKCLNWQHVAQYLLPKNWHC